MSQTVRPKEFALAVVFAFSCLSTSYSQTPSPTPTSPPSRIQASPTPAVPSPTTSPLTQGAPTPSPLLLEEALRLANTQASTFQTAAINERIAAEDVRQAQAAFLPKVTTPLSYIYTSPSSGRRPGEPRAPSFISADAIGVTDALVNVAGDFDIAGRLRATLARNRALLAAAHAGTEAARRTLAQAVIEAYYGLALANAQRRAAEGNLAAAAEFEKITALLLSGGEVAPVDLTRAQLQTLARRDELQRAAANEDIATGALRVFVGYEFSQAINTTDLAVAIPIDSEYQQFRAEDVSRRPEFIQLEQEIRAAQQELKIAHADRLPSLSYSINGGFDTDSLKGARLKQRTGVSAAVSLSIPIFDWGATRSREQQARLRAELAENERTLALRGFMQQFYAARAQVERAVARIAWAREGITKAENNVAASVARYRAGEAQIVEVTDAQTTLVDQRNALYQAIFDYQTSLARLRQATGQ